MMEESFDVRASIRYAPISPQKVRLVLDLVRNQPATEALDLLRFTQNAAAKTVYKLLRSAIANAEENYGINRGDLVIHRIYADKVFRKFSIALRSSFVFTSSARLS